MAQVLASFEQALERARLKRGNWVLRRALSQHTPPAGGLGGSSTAIKGLQTALNRVAAVDSTVLLTGESGTGLGRRFSRGIVAANREGGGAAFTVRLKSAV